VLNQFVGSSNLGAKLTVAGSYYQVKKGDAAAVLPLQTDTAKLPKCDAADACGWECAVNKELKVPTTAGEFVKWCIVPSLQ